MKIIKIRNIVATSNNITTIYKGEDKINEGMDTIYSITICYDMDNCIEAGFGEDQDKRDSMFEKLIEFLLIPESSVLKDNILILQEMEVNYER